MGEEASPARRAIVLTGFMGTGKTEVGRRLAERLGRPFVDTDRLVEELAGRTIAQIFAGEGERGFRAFERQAVAIACQSAGAVIATGGGAMLDAENRARLKAAGWVVCLTASPEAILDRVGCGGERPLLVGGPPLERIRALLAARAAAYATADGQVDTTGREVEDVVAEVLQTAGVAAAPARADS